MGIVVVMGVSGAGKSTVGRALADRMDIAFVEGDRLHPPENVQRMASGLPLDDELRKPWLDAVAAEIERHATIGADLVITCSALRQRYRDRLREAGSVRFILLRPDLEELARRLDERDHEYMPAELLASQLDALEVPDHEPDVLVIQPADTVGGTVDRVMAALG